MPPPGGNMYEVKVYKSTGFNAVNIPDRPALLEQFGVETMPSIDVVQDGLLNHVDVRTTWDNIKSADYVKVGEWYYIVTELYMTSGDVCRLMLLPDFLLSAGGAASVQYLDGITERVHVPKAEDYYGAYAEADPLMAPSRPLEIESEYIVPSSTKNINFLESTVDLIPTSGSAENFCQRFADSQSEAYVDVPYLPPAYPPTTYHLSIGNDIQRGTRLYNADNAVVQQRVSLVRALGMESGIIDQYSIPDGFFIGGVPSENTYHSYDSLNCSLINTFTQTIKFKYGSGVKNNRVYYGEHTPFGLLTVAGNRGEFRAEQLIPSDGVVTDDSAPAVQCSVDLQPDGRPYWRFDTVNKNMDFWLNALAGEEWQRLPLIYTDRSNSYLNRQTFEANREIARATYDAASLGIIANYVDSAGRTINRGLDLQNDYDSAGLNGAAFTAGILGQEIGGMIRSSVTAYFSMQVAADLFNAHAQKEVLSYANANKAIAPEIAVTFSPKIIRDVKGNGAWVYRFKYSQLDLTRIDNLLTMYGYRLTKRITQDLFSNRKRFNYVKASGVSIGGTSLPRWWREGIAAQLSAGTRIWHTAPTVAGLTDNDE